MFQILSALCPLAGAATAIFLNVRNKKRNVKIAPAVAVVAANKRAKLDCDFIRLRPDHWYDSVIVLLIIFVMPVLQWHSYLHFRSLFAILLPLVLLCGMQLLLKSFHPNVVSRQNGDYRARVERFVVGSIMLLATCLLPPTGVILVLRGLMIDLVGFFAMALLIQFLQNQKDWERLT